MATVQKGANKHLKMIVETLEGGYLPSHPRARIDAYMYRRVLVCVRIIDPDVAGIHIMDRSGPVWKILEPLPDETFTRIGVLFIITPDEARTSEMNYWFERDAPPSVRDAIRLRPVVAKRTGRGAKPRLGPSNGQE